MSEIVIFDTLDSDEGEWFLLADRLGRLPTAEEFRHEQDAQEDTAHDEHHG